MSWKRFFRRSKWDEERHRELEAHIEIEVEENVRAGMEERAAREAARRKLGNMSQIREEIYRMNSFQVFEELVQDLRHGMRLLAANMSFSVVAVVTLALGIGANTAIFQLLDAVRMRNLPVKNPQELVEVRSTQTRGVWARRPSRFPFETSALWDQIRAGQQAFASVAAWSSSSFDLSPSGESRITQNGMFVSGDFFSMLGVQPMLGRVFTAEDDKAGCGAAAGETGVVISHAFWTREFGGAADVIGRVLTLDGNRVPVIGVTPRGFFGVEVGKNFDLAVPICLEPVFRGKAAWTSNRIVWWLSVLGRLQPGWTVERANAHFAAMSPAWFEATVPPQYDATTAGKYRALQLHVRPAASGLSWLRAGYETPLWLLFAIAGVVLLIACANLANLMLARAAVREREIAVRLAMGASRGRLIRQLLTESLLLAGIGAAFGALLARSLSGLLIAALGTPADPVYIETSTDWRMLAFTATVAVLTCVLTGLTPALRAARTDPAAAMKSGGRGTTSGQGRFGLRRALVVMQVALSLVLVFGAVLFVRTLRNLGAVDAGFRQTGIVMANVDLSRLKVPAGRMGAAKVDLAKKVAQMHGVDAAATTNSAPASGNNWIQSVVIQKERKGFTNMARVGSGYFETIGMRIVNGRDIGDQDRAGAPRVAVVNEIFAKKYWNGENPVGRTFELGENGSGAADTIEIVGVVTNSKYNDLREDFVPIAFISELQDPNTGADTQIMIRSSLPLADLLTQVRRGFAEENPLINYQFQVLETELGNTLVLERLMAGLSGFFGGLAALLAAIGLYGVISYMAARRRNEIGIRMALGATRGQVARLVLREAGWLVGVGLVIGAGLAIAASNTVESMLYGLTARDPLTLAGAAGLLAVVALVASYLPARRASGLDPMTALREE